MIISKSIILVTIGVLVAGCSSKSQAVPTVRDTQDLIAEPKTEIPKNTEPTAPEANSEVKKLIQNCNIKLKNYYNLEQIAFVTELMHENCNYDLSQIQSIVRYEFNIKDE